MKVKTIKKFIDKKEGMKTRKIGDVFEVTKERFKEINSTSHGIIVEEVTSSKEEKKNG